MAENTTPAETSPKELLANLSRVERSAILLMSLGEKDAAEILKHLGPKESSESRYFDVEFKRGSTGSS